MARSRNIGSLNAELTLRDLKFRAGLARAQKTLKSFGRMAARAAAAGAVAAAAGVGVVMAKAISAAADMEMTEATFEVLTGSAEDAKKMIQELRAEAVKSPIGFTHFAKAARTLIGFGAAQDKVVETTSMLSEVSMGNAEQFKFLTKAFADTTSVGRLMGQEMKQYVNSGFNPLQQIAERTGETMLLLRKRMEAGLIPLSEVEQAFKDATSEGGRFFRMNKKASATFNGKVEKMKDAWDQMLIAIGTPIIDRLKPALDSIIAFDWAGTGEKIGKDLAMGFDFLTSGHIWELFALEAQLQISKLLQSAPFLALTAGIATFADIVSGKFLEGGFSVEGAFNENQKKYAGLTDRILEKIALLHDDIGGENFTVKKDGEIETSRRGSDRIAKSIRTFKKPEKLKMEMSDFQRRGLSLSKDPGSIQQKVLRIQEEIRDILKGAETDGMLKWAT